MCFYLDGDDSEKKGQISHLDGDASNTQEDNLAFLCGPHHDDLDCIHSQVKGLTKKEVKYARDQLYFYMAEHPAPRTTKLSTQNQSERAREFLDQVNGDWDLRWYKARKQRTEHLKIDLDGNYFSLAPGRQHRVHCQLEEIDYDPKTRRVTFTKVRVGRSVRGWPKKEILRLSKDGMRMEGANAGTWSRLEYSRPPVQHVDPDDSAASFGSPEVKHSSKALKPATRPDLRIRVKNEIREVQSVESVNFQMTFEAVNTASLHATISEGRVLLEDGDSELVAPLSDRRFGLEQGSLDIGKDGQSAFFYAITGSVPLKGRGGRMPVIRRLQLRLAQEDDSRTYVPGKGKSFEEAQPALEVRSMGSRTTDGTISIISADPSGRQT